MVSCEVYGAVLAGLYERVRTYELMSPRDTSDAFPVSEKSLELVAGSLGGLDGRGVRGLDEQAESVHVEMFEGPGAQCLDGVRCSSHPSSRCCDPVADLGSTSVEMGDPESDLADCLVGLSVDDGERPSFASGEP